MELLLDAVDCACKDSVQGRIVVILKHQLSRTRITESPRKNLDKVSNEVSFVQRGAWATTHILLMKRSLFTGRPFLPEASRGVSVHISFTFSKTMLQCRSKAFTRARSLRLLRHEINTWVCERTAVCRMDSGPDVNSCSSIRAISYSLFADA